MYRKKSLMKEPAWPISRLSFLSVMALLGVVLFSPAILGAQSGLGIWSMSAHGGVAIPRGSLADDFSSSYNFLLDVDYHFAPQWALVGFLGYNHFSSTIDGVDDTYWINLSLNLRYNYIIPLEPGPVFLIYLQAGPGLYIPKDGDLELGANGGFGIDYCINPPWCVEVGTDYHYIFGPEIDFIHAHAGVVLRF